MPGQYLEPAGAEPSLPVSRGGGAGLEGLQGGEVNWPLGEEWSLVIKHPHRGLLSVATWQSLGLLGQGTACRMLYHML